MSKLRVASIIQECDVPSGQTPSVITISNHWNLSGLVNVMIDGKEHAFEADALIKAIQNAQNAH